MKERPILFSAPMVRAILDGRKTQTRRVVKPQPDFAAQPTWAFGPGHSGVGWYCGETEYPDEGSVFYRCPYGVPGDRLWVRETHRFYGPPNGPMSVEYAADYEDKIAFGFVKWRPSIHMPRWASRIMLEVTEVRVERVQEISPEDATEEGIEPLFDGIRFLNYRDYSGGELGLTPVGSFRTLWDSINAKRGYGWDINPWVWVISFEVLP